MPCAPKLCHFAGLQASTIVMIAVGARIPQIVMNYKRGNSGELSLLTCLMNVMGCVTRLFTTFVLTKVSSSPLSTFVLPLSSIQIHVTLSKIRHDQKAFHSYVLG